MTNEQKREFQEVAVAALLVILLAWIVYHFLTSKGSGTPLTTTPVELSLTSPVVSPTATPSGGDGNCTSCALSGSCPASPYTIPGVSTILANSAAANAQIEALGQATLDQLAAIEEQANPLVQVTVDQSGSIS
jgi:hypothetical protein